MTTQFTTKRRQPNSFHRSDRCLLRSDSGGRACTGTEQVKHKQQYQVSNLPGLRGTSSGGNSINNQSLGGRLFQTNGRPNPARCAVAKRFALRPRHTRRTKQQCHMEREKYRGHHRGYFPDCHAGAAGGELEQLNFLQWSHTTPGISILALFGNKT